MTGKKRPPPSRSLSKIGTAAVSAQRLRVVVPGLRAFSDEIQFSCQNLTQSSRLNRIPLENARSTVPGHITALC